ncbi:hypothetical protein V7056_04945 [Bacillus sp. JJ664]
MMQCTWINFQLENEELTQERFEEMMDDHFQAVKLDDTGFPQYIWTSNFVFIVIRRVKLIEEIEFKQIPRNPACE